MRKALFWAGVLLLAFGIAMVGASAVLTYLGLSASFNLGDPAKFQFILVPFWQVGLGLAVLGAICILVARWIKERRPAARGS
jgi:hypothetical protein